MLRSLVFIPGRHEPGIVTTDLVFYFDPGNQDSYPGTGNTLYDLSGNNNHLSTSNFSLADYLEGSSFNIGSGRSLHGTISNGLNATIYSITISAWIKGSSTTRYQYPCAYYGSGGSLYFDMNDTDSSSLYKSIWFYWNSGGAPLCGLTLGSLGGNALNSGHSDLLDGNWHCVTFRRDMNNSPYTDIFINGTKISAGNPGVQRYGNQTGQGGWSAGSEWYYGWNTFTGNIGSSWMYKTALTDAQILQNFNSEKSKYL